jgi:threonine aldolase
MEPTEHRHGAKNQFASDNYSGICPEAWQALQEANSGYANAYGDDIWTARACNSLRDFFETDCQVFFVFNGTAANSLALSALCRSYHSIICHDLAHIETDECGAPEFFSNGTKVLLVSGVDGKVDPVAIDHVVTRRADIHYPKAKVLSLTQATELGTVYTADDLRSIRDVVDRHALKLHMDGARFSNAVASLGVSPKELTWQAGVDVLTFGGAKSGMALGEAVVFFNKTLAEEFDYRCKQAGQLASKMRFLSAPWCGMLADNALLVRAGHANAMARELAAQLSTTPTVEIVHPVEANAVFIRMPQALLDGLKASGWHFYTFIGTGEARLMCSWQTTPDDIQALVADLHKLIDSSE